jgi:2-alkyl-3-oxoalkanoate reductase
MVVHIQDTAHATAAALIADPGRCVVVDDISPVGVWLPSFARFVDAPPCTIADQPRQFAGEDAVTYQTSLSGASNAKAKPELNLTPRRLEWLSTLSQETARRQVA